MGLTSPSTNKNYKIKLSGGRVLGPLGLNRICQLILKNQVVGTELAQEYPHGEWKDINSFSELGDLIVANATGELEKYRNQHILPDDENLDNPGSILGTAFILDSTQVLPGAGQPLATQVLELLPENDAALSSSQPSLQSEDDDKTMVGNLAESPSAPVEEEATRVFVEEDREKIAQSSQEVSETNLESEIEERFTERAHQISQEKTVIFQRSSDSSKLPGKRQTSKKEILKAAFIAIGLGYFGYDAFLADPPKKSMTRIEVIRPKLPEFSKGNSDPNQSSQIYGDAMKYYVVDNVQGYKKAANRLRQAASLDINNVKALAMLASSYLNLIDYSNKDENYFSVISKLIDMSRAKAVDLSETVIADVEFYLVVKKAEAAQNRIVEYTKSHQNYGLELFYYLALAFYSRGEPVMAARYLNQIPDNKAFSVKIFFLRGLVAEKVGDVEAALKEYKKAIQVNPNHAKSHLKIAEILNKHGSLKDAAPHLEFIISHPDLLNPRELALSYYLHAQLSELYQKWALALGDVERATKLDPENHDYLLELFTLRARSGESLKTAQEQARMYYYLGEGEKLIQKGKYQEALVPFLQARQSNEKSPLPLVKMGDMFTYLHDTENAKRNYKTAANLAPDNVQIWSKYIQMLIISYELEDAKAAMDRFRKLPVSQSAIDKLAADVYQKQGRFVEAQVLYKKAMARDVIDPDVYIAYGKSLMSTKNFKDAPFFFALALRFDPLNVDAITGTAKCIAETESIDRAISSLQDELKLSNGARAEFLSAIAEFQIQKGAWDQAQQNIDQAMKANPDYAFPWKLQAMVYMNKEGVDKEALDKALFAYKSYSERNSSDPSGYMERYKIFIKKTEFERAKAELSKIYEIYPKYPNLHYYLGRLYSIQGNHVTARDEFRAELVNNADNVDTLIAYGKELLELGKNEDALTVFTKSMQLAPLSSDAKQNAGWANNKLKHYQAAIALLQAALATDKANPMIFKRLGVVYRDMGDIASACNSFRKYLEMEPDAPDKAEFAACMK